MDEFTRLVHCRVVDGRYLLWYGGPEGGKDEEWNGMEGGVEVVVVKGGKII